MVIRTLAALGAAAALSVSAAHAACDATAQIAECEARLAADYHVLNTYTLAGEEAGEALSIADDHVLSSRMSYQVAICGADDIEFVLESGARKPLLTNKSDDGFQPILTIEPERSRVYYLVFNLPEADTCAGAVLGMKQR